MIKTDNLITVLREAVSDYIGHSSEYTPSEWLQDYLGRNLQSESAEDIQCISSEIITTLDVMESKHSAMEKAIASGQSSETWFASEIMADTEGNGEKAQKAAALFNGVILAENSFAEPVEISEIMISENEAQWQNDEWNDFKLKGTLKDVASASGRAGIKEVASDIFVKASEDGADNSFADGETIADTLVNGACTGLKTAIAGGVKVAESRGILPKTPLKAIAAIAYKTVESMKVFSNVIKGKATVTEALIEIKDTAISTAAAIWDQHKEKVKEEVTSVVKSVFGVTGAVVAGAVNGLVNRKEGESRLKSVVKGVCQAAKTYVAEKVQKIPFVGKLVSKLFS